MLRKASKRLRVPAAALALAALVGGCYYNPYYPYYGGYYGYPGGYAGYPYGGYYPAYAAAPFVVGLGLGFGLGSYPRGYYRGYGGYRRW